MNTAKTDRKAIETCLKLGLSDKATIELVQRILEKCPADDPKDREALTCQLVRTVLMVCEGKVR